MLMNHADIAPARFSAVLDAAEAAARAIPPDPHRARAAA